LKYRRIQTASNGILRQSTNLTAAKVIGLPGLYKYDPANGFDLYRREFALVNNEQQPINNDSNAKLKPAITEVMNHARGGVRSVKGATIGK